MVTSIVSLLALGFVAFALGDTAKKVEEYDEFWVEKVKPILVFGGASTIG